MAEVNPPPFLQNGEYSAIALRRAVTADVRTPGIINSGDLVVLAQATPNMSVRVLAGEAYVPGTRQTNQGFYYVYNDGAKTVTVSPANSTNPRKDLIIARVRDTEQGDSVDAWSIEVVAGTPGSNPATPTLPPDSYALAELTVAAGASSINSAAISNRRQFASVMSSRYAMIHGHRSTGVVGTPPNTITDFIYVAGSALFTTNGQGESFVQYPTPSPDADHVENFPNGVVSVVCSPGFASPPFVTNINHGGHTRLGFQVRCYNLDGNRLSSTQVRVNYVALGW